MKKINEKPTIADEIKFDILCPGSDGCFTSDPYKVDNISIYYVQRDFTSNNVHEFNKDIIDQGLLDELSEAKKVACVTPTDDNFEIINEIQARIEASKQTETSYFHEARAVSVVGTETFPAWLSTDVDNAFINHIQEDSDGNTLYGHYELEWNPQGMREGDYVITWSWSPLIAGEKLNTFQHFFLNGETVLTTSLPTHRTNKDKYDTLMDRYLPDMFKTRISPSDITPEVLQEFNGSLSELFTFIEDLANQSIDLIDANATHEAILPYLARLSNTRLRSTDPTLWRRQIKNSVPLLKKKGTLNGLKETLNQAGISLSKYTSLWQVKSNYLFQESFLYSDSLTFDLEQVAILPTDDNFSLYRLSKDSNTWTELSLDHLDITTNTIEWIGNQVDPPLDLEQGDIIRIIYKIKEIPNEDQQTIENYIKTLPVADLRDERNQEFPLKNWNIRVIEQDDPMFDIIITDRHPFFDDLIYGQIRTEFPYSENVYNMEEYNGSTRDSKNPCHIDNSFLDPCHSCQSSMYNLDLEVDQLSDSRIEEAKEIIRETTPFHSVLHSLNLVGKISDFIKSPIENIYKYVQFKHQEFMITDAQNVFSRVMNPSINRDELASVSSVHDDNDWFLNEHVVLFSPNVKISQLALDKSDPTLTHLEVLSGANVGSYNIENPFSNYAYLPDGSTTGTIDQSNFTFRLSNEIIEKSSGSIEQDNLFYLHDENVDYGQTGIISEYDDVDNWKIEISAYSDTYNIVNIMPDGSILLSDPSGTLPASNTSGITYKILNNDDEIQKNSSTGRLVVISRGLADLSGSVLVRGESSSIEDLRNIIKENYYLKVGSNQYKINGFESTDKVYLQNYSEGDQSGVTLTVYHRLADNKVGSFHYKGLKLSASTNLETTLGITNGENPPADPNDVLENNKFKENFLILVDDNYYSISKIDGSEVWLHGLMQDWTLEGETNDYEIFQYTKENTSVEVNSLFGTSGNEFYQIDRRGNEIINSTEEDIIGALNVLNTNPSNIQDFVSQGESISYSIEYKEDD